MKYASKIHAHYKVEAEATAWVLFKNNELDALFSADSSTNRDKIIEYFNPSDLEEKTGVGSGDEADEATIEDIIRHGKLPCTFSIKRDVYTFYRMKIY